MCVLCKDTFSRSDILKRHFQKCSARRGNPAGLSHLSSPAAHLKKSQAGAAKSAADPLSTATTPTANGMPNGTFPTAAMGAGSMSSTPTTFTEAPSLPYSMSTAPSNTLQRSNSEQQFNVSGQNSMAHSANGSWSMQNAKQNSILFQP